MTFFQWKKTDLLSEFNMLECSSRSISSQYEMKHCKKWEIVLSRVQHGVIYTPPPPGASKDNKKKTCKKKKVINQARLGSFEIWVQRL